MNADEIRNQQARTDFLELQKLNPLDRVFEASAMMDDARARMTWLAHYRALAVAELRNAGLRVEAIADQLRVSRQTVHRLIREAHGQPPSVLDLLEETQHMDTATVPKPRCPLCGAEITSVNTEYTAEQTLGHGASQLRRDPEPTGYVILQPCGHRWQTAALGGDFRPFRLDESRLDDPSARLG